MNNALDKRRAKDAAGCGPLRAESRFRQLANAVYLNGKGYRIKQLADIFVVDRDTVSGWLAA